MILLKLLILLFILWILDVCGIIQNLSSKSENLLTYLILAESVYSQAGINHFEKQLITNLKSSLAALRLLDTFNTICY